MALRYRRRINILPGVHLNVSRSGISTTLGVRGASMTFGKNGRYVNTGIPGTGVSWRSRVGATPHEQELARAEHTPAEAHAAAVPYHSHHLHWWKVALFIVLLAIAGATKSNAFIGLFWFGYFAYWFLLFVRLVTRKSREKSEELALADGKTEAGVR